MVAAAALGDVVEEDRGVEHPARGDVAEKGGGERMVGLGLAFLDPREQADRPDRMLVDRIMMIHVELHLGDDPAEVGNEAAEHPGLVHPPQHRLRIARAGQDFQEEGVGAGIVAHFVDQLGVAGGGAHRQRMDFELVEVGQSEDLEESNRILAEIIVVRQGEPAAVEDEAFKPARPAPDRRQAEAPALPGELLVEMGEEDPGQIADGFGVKEIMAHEALDRRLAGPVGVAHPAGDLALIVEGQAILGAAGDQMEVAAHRPQEALGPPELVELGRREEIDLDQIRDFPHLIGIFADPEERVEIAKAAFAFLHVGLDDVAAVAHPAVTGVPLLELLGDEFLRLAGDDLLPEARLDLVEQGLVAPQPARLQQGGSDRMVARRERDQFVDRPGRRAELQPQVPQEIKDRLDRLNRPSGRACRE